MANLVLVVGDTGTGKSTSTEGLDYKETFIINCSNKPLPYKGSSKLYSKENKNTAFLIDANAILPILKVINEKQPHIKKIVIDDSGFIMTEEFFAKALDTGFEKFTLIAQHYQSILSYAKSMRDDLDIAIMLHDEDVNVNAVKSIRKVRTVGKLVDEKYNPLSVVTIALFSVVTFAKDGTPEYNFITNRCIVNGTEIPAKSPRGMFEEAKIANDLNLVFTKAREYYNN